MDLQKFLAAALAPRQETVAVPELAAWFAPDAPAVWVLRGLSAAELARANEAANGGLDKVRAMVAALAGDGDKAGAIRAVMGLSAEDVPTDSGREAGRDLSDDFLPADQRHQQSDRARG